MERLIENLPFTPVTYQILRCSIACASLTAWILQTALPSHSKQRLDEQTLLGQGKVYRGAQTKTLLVGEGERGKIIADCVNCSKNFGLHCSTHLT